MGSKEWVFDCVIERLKDGEDKLFQELYKAYKEEFTTWLQHYYSVDSSTALDCFQEAMSNLYMNACTGHIQSSQYSIKSYLFAIGKNQLLKRDRKYRREADSLITCEETTDHLVHNLYDPVKEKELESKKVDEVLDTIDKPCRQLLELVYLSPYTYEEIAEKLGYSQRVLRTKKWRCLKKLRSQFNQ